MASKRGRLVLGIVLTALATLVIVSGPNLWLWVTIKRIPFQGTYSGHIVRGWEIESRSDGSFRGHVRWFVENGMKASESKAREVDHVREERWGVLDYHRLTGWNFDGTVNYQMQLNQGRRENKKESPWWWNAKDQTGPSAPWWSEKETLKNGYNEYVDVWGHKIRGPFTETRRANEPRQWVFYYVDSGFKAEEGEEAGMYSKKTVWNFDGTVRDQIRPDGHPRSDPPWWWGVTDQTEPTAPWWNEKDK